MKPLEKSPQLENNVLQVPRRRTSSVPLNLDHLRCYPLRHTVPRPPNETKDTTLSEFYGFAIYLMSFIIFGIIMLWAYVPDECFFEIGISYLPKKSWAYRIPSFLLLTLYFIFAFNTGYMLSKTPPLTSYRVITDENADVNEVESSEEGCKLYIPDLYDVPLWKINEKYL